MPVPAACLIWDPQALQAPSLDAAFCLVFAEYRSERETFVATAAVTLMTPACG